jgi:prepilin-type processing-associated H-X9-DG protein
VLGGVKTKAQRTVCLNNLRQISLGVRMYSDDSHDASPSPGSAGLPPGRMDTLYSGYKALMKSYVGLNNASSPRDKLFACPADVFNIGAVLDDQAHLFQNVKKSCHDLSSFDYSSYVFNGGDNVIRHFEGKSFTIPGLTGVKLGSVRHPDRTVLLAEVAATVPYSWHDPLSHGAGIPPGTIYNDSKNMVSFVDGHVSYIKMYYKYPVCACLTNPPAGYAYQWTPD